MLPYHELLVSLCTLASTAGLLALYITLPSDSPCVACRDHANTMERSRALIPLLVSMMLLTGVCNTLLTKYQVRDPLRAI